MATELRPIEQAPLHGRRLLGALLAQRRQELGYTYWPQFAKDRLPLTSSGNPNTRILADIEKAYRDNFPEPRLRQLARAYMVSYESLVAVAHMRTGALSPLRSAAEAEVTRPLPAAPMDDDGRTAADRPYADRIWAGLRAWAAKGVTDPSGAQLFGAGTQDAEAWDGTAGRMDEGDRVWHIADLQRFGDRNPNDKAAAGA